MKPVKSATEWLDNQKASSFHYLLIVLSFFVLVFDGYDSQILSYILPQAIKEWHLTPVVAGSMASYGFIGLIIGTTLFGMLADSMGRKKALMIAIADFTIFSGAAYFAPSFQVFCAMRLLAGIGMGGAMPITIALVSEYAPAKIRGKAVTAMFSGFTSGWILAALAAMGIVPTFGWRIVLLMGVLPIIYIPVLIKFLPESIRFLGAKGRVQDAIRELRKIEKATGVKPIDWKPEHFVVVQAQAKGSIKDLFTPQFALMTILISITYFFNLLTVYGLSSWLPTLLVKKGFSLVKSYSFGMTQAIMASVGAIIIGSCIDAFGRKKTMIPAYVLGAISIVFFGKVNSYAAMMVAAGFTGFFIMGAQTAQHVITGETFPTKIRSTGTGFVYSIGRVGSLVAPILGGAMVAAGFTFSSFFLVFAIFPVICAVTFALYKVSHQGETLEEFTAELTGHEVGANVSEGA